MACKVLVIAGGVEFPDQGSSPRLLHRECGTLASGPAGRCLVFLFLPWLPGSSALTGMFSSSSSPTPSPAYAKNTQTVRGWWFPFLLHSSAETTTGPGTTGLVVPCKRALNWQCVFWDNWVDGALQEGT